MERSFRGQCGGDNNTDEDSIDSFWLMALGVSKNYSLEAQIIFELGNYTVTWKAGKRFWR